MKKFIFFIVLFIVVVDYFLWATGSPVKTIIVADIVLIITILFSFIFADLIDRSSL